MRSAGTGSVPARCSSRARHRYQAAAERYGLQRSPQAASAFGCGMIAANEVGHDKAFDCEDNQLIVLGRNARHELARADKLTLARGLIALIGAELAARFGVRKRGSALA